MLLIVILMEFIAGLIFIVFTGTPLIVVGTSLYRDRKHIKIGTALMVIGCLFTKYSTILLFIGIRETLSFKV